MPLRLMAAAGITTLALDGGYLRAGTASSLESGLVASVCDGGTLTLRAGAASASSRSTRPSSAPESATRGHCPLCLQEIQGNPSEFRLDVAPDESLLIEVPRSATSLPRPRSRAAGRW
jgi:hypothetical protein